jgi:hypothetical protein
MADDLLDIERRMTDLDLSEAIDIADLGTERPSEGRVLVKSARKGYPRVERDGDRVNVSNPWRRRETVFVIAPPGDHAAAHWTRADGTRVAADGLHVGRFIDSALPLPFFDFNLPADGADDIVARN